MSDRPNYKELLIEVRGMLSGIDLYEIAVKLNAVFEESQFRDDSRARDDFRAADRLDSELSWLNVSFLGLRKALELYPDKADWTRENIRHVLETGEKKRERKPRSRRMPSREIMEASLALVRDGW